MEEKNSLIVYKSNFKIFAVYSIKIKEMELLMKMKLLILINVKEQFD